MKLSSYKQFMETALGIIASKDAKDYLDVVSKTASYAANLKSQALKERIIYNQAYAYISRSEVDGAEPLVQLVVNHVKNADKIKTLDALVGKWSKIAKGQQAPSFTYPDVNGNKVSLADLKGKYVYIDCWASWCGPCIGEIPHLKKLKKRFKGKNIEFVGLSTDADKEAWKKMLEKKKLEGIQLNIDGDQTFMQTYMISGIPRFILIDKEGKIYNANAPRPSSENIMEYLDGLIGI